MTDPLNATAAEPPALKILVVDDSAMMRNMIKRTTMLTGLPIGEIFEAGDGQEALQILHQQHVDALLTDINMPRMTGIELLKQIASDERWRHIVRVIVSSDGSEARCSEADALNVHLYVRKPFRPEAIRDVLANVTPR